MEEGLDDDSVLALGAGTADERTEALNALLVVHGGKMLSFIKRVVADRAGAHLVQELSEEIYQETWLRVADPETTGKLFVLPEKDRPKYLFGICRNVAHDYFRQFKRAPSMVTYEEDEIAAKQTINDKGPELNLPDVLAAINECIERLTGQVKVVFKLRHTTHKEPLTSRDIGAALQVADTTVRAYLKQGTDSVKDCMRRKGFSDKIRSKEQRS